MHSEDETKAFMKEALAAADAAYRDKEVVAALYPVLTAGRCLWGVLWFIEAEVCLSSVYYHLLCTKVIATGGNQTNKTRNATRHAELVAYDQVVADHHGDLAIVKEIMAGK